MSKLTLTVSGILITCSLSAQQWENSSDPNNINNKNSGNVGIGYSAPFEKLHVQGSAFLFGNIRLGQEKSNVGQGSQLIFNDNGNTDPIWMARYNTASDASELRMNIGDVSDQNDKFVIGYTVSGTWTPTFSFLSDGKMGVGITNPAYPLDVNGSIRSKSSIISDVAQPGEIGGFFRGASNGYANVVLQSGAGQNRMYWLTATNDVFRIGGHGAAEPGAGALNISWDGKVGFGNSEPSSLVHIGAKTGAGGTPYSSSTLLQVFQPFNTTTPSASIDLGMCQPHARITGFGNVTDNSIGQLAFSTMKHGVINEVMRITSDGNVGIGTTTPGLLYKLAVDGKIVAREIKVKDGTPWPDYVFEKDYNLMSLTDLEAFIKKNNHLPNIPSAKEVEEKEGIELGAMNAKLLEKIEELTLHLIEMNKEMQSLRKENQAIKEEVKVLSAKQETRTKQ
jgi:hypothetical protein